MADLRIVDAPLLLTVKGTEKLPTGGEGNFSVSIDQVADFAKLKWVLATEGYVDTTVSGVRSELVTHVSNINNPHQVTKSQIGLGNVDNTADVDKPIGSATQAALTTLSQNKAEKTYVDTQLNTKADKSTTYSKTETDSLVSVKSDTSYVNTKYSSHIKTFLNTGAALSNTVNGEYFFIISSDSEKVEDLYLNVNGVATNQNKSELSSLLQHNSILGRDVTGAHQATSISTASGVNQQDINDFGGAKWYNKAGGYELNARVMLTNGDIVKSTVANNIIDPNVSMTGWELNNKTRIDNGVLEVYTNGTWQAKAPSYYDFGAKIDGVTDDTSAFIAYHKIFKSAKLPKGRMLLSSIDLDQFKNGQSVGISIEGDGTEQSYFDFTGALGFYSASNVFFRDFKLKNLQVNRKLGDNVGIGVYIGSGGAEQIHFENVTYRGWLIGRATHCWNSSMKDEVFRACTYPFSQYGTSTNISNPYAVNCPSPYMLGYQATSAGVLSVPSIPYAYSMLSGFAADDCGLNGSVYKFGRCSGLTAISMSCERPKGAHVFDFEDMVATVFSNVVIDNFSMYITTADTALLGLIKKPTTPAGNIIFNNPKIATDKQIYMVSGDGSGIQFINPQMGNLSFSRISDTAALGLRVNQVSYGRDTQQSNELGLSLSANGQTYSRVKNRKGKVLIDATTQKLVIYGGSLSEGLAQGLMTVANITANPISKSGNNTNEKAGQILMSSAMDYNAGNMAGHLKTVLTGTLTTLTTVTRNTGNTTQLQFDVIIESSHSSSRVLLDIDLTYNGISNPSGIAWEVQSK